MGHLAPMQDLTNSTIVLYINNKLQGYIVPSCRILRQHNALAVSPQFRGKPVCPVNKPFPSWLVPLCQNETSCETIHIKMCSPYRFISMQIKLIFIWKVLHEDSFWNRGTSNSEMAYCLGIMTNCYGETIDRPPCWWPMFSAVIRFWVRGSTHPQ